MKKNILSITALTLIATASVLTGCKKDDITAPVVTLIGDASKTVFLQGSYTEESATAEDDKDGKLTPSISGSVDLNQTGVYTITYTATDAAGNSGTATRTVTVENAASGLSGTYTCTIADTPPYVYTQTVTASTTLNNSIIFGKFGDYAGNTTIHAEVVGSNISIPSQTAVQVGTAPNKADRVFSGTGLKTSNGFNLNYTETTGGKTIATVETFVKQ